MTDPADKDRIEEIRKQITGREFYNSELRFLISRLEAVTQERDAARDNHAEDHSGLNALLLALFDRDDIGHTDGVREIQRLKQELKSIKSGDIMCGKCGHWTFLDAGVPLKRVCGNCHSADGFVTYIRRASETETMTQVEFLASELARAAAHIARIYGSLDGEEKFIELNWKAHTNTARRILSELKNL